MTANGQIGVRDHTFDGIQEFENRLPNWWLWSFYLACIFSVFYWIHYHTLRTGASALQAYDQEVEVAAAEAEARELAKPVTDQILLALKDDPAAIAEGKKHFAANCVTCHLASGGGIVGPNLTDEYWLHGSAPTAIYKTVMEGVVGKQMMAWKTILGAKRCKEVVAYMLADIVNTNVAGGRAPEGERDG